MKIREKFRLFNGVFGFIFMLNETNLIFIIMGLISLLFALMFFDT